MTKVQYDFRAPAFDSGDFALYDTVPDGVLYLDELNDRKLLDEYVSRLINTRNRAAADTFVFGLSREAKEFLAGCIEEVLNSPELSASFNLSEEDKERLRFYLDNALRFGGSKVGFSLSGKYKHSQSDSLYDVYVDEGIYDSESLVNSTDEYALAPKLTFQNETLFGTYRLTSAFDAGLDWGRTVYEEERLREDNQGEVIPQMMREDMPLSPFIKPKFSFARGDDFGVWTGVWLGGSNSEIPSAFKFGYSPWLGAKMLNVGGSRFSWEAELNFGENKYNAPEQPEELQKQKSNIGADANVSATITETTGITSDYNFTRTRDQGGYSLTNVDEHDADVKFQWTPSKKHHLESSAGYTYEDKESESVILNQRIQTAAHNGKLGVSYDFNPNEVLRLNFGGGGGVGSISGSWNGIYPLYWADADVSWNPMQGRLYFGVGTQGSLTNLEYREIEGFEEDFLSEGKYLDNNLDVNANLGGTHNPKDWLSYSGNFRASYTESRGDLPDQGYDIGGDADISLRCFSKPFPLWISVSGWGGTWQSEDKYFPSYLGDGLYYGASLSVSGENLWLPELKKKRN